jgi:uncharacterized membrane protein
MIFFAIFGVLVVIALLIAVFRYLWNTTLPQIFGLPPITFWQGFRLLLLAGFLFGGFRYANNGTSNLEARLTSIETKIDDFSTSFR